MEKKMKLYITVFLVLFASVQNATAFNWWEYPPKNPVTGTPILVSPGGEIINQTVCHDAQSVMTTGLEMIDRGKLLHNNALILQGAELVHQAEILFLICGIFIHP